MKKIGVGFSGGLDSSLLAYLASKYVEVKLISVHKKNSRDERITDKAASKLDLEIEHITIDEEYIRKTLPTIEYLIEDNQLMNLSIATIMFLSAKKVSELKLEGLFVGQLADELFGGYVKYLHSMENGKEHVNKMLYNDIRYAYKNNFPRDEKSVSPFSYLFMPYSSINLVDYSIGIPLEFKINQNELIRKKILREAAIISGMDKYIANEPKKAAQYSSGTQNIIRKIIKSNETNKYN
jgi:asparagine synthase (glutamine-hydrolysing)